MTSSLVSLGRRVAAGGLVFAVAFGASGPLEANETLGLTFERDIRPILKEACFHCHGESGVREGGLDLRLVRLMLDGGDSGAAIAPQAPEDSLLWQRLATDEMPEGEKKLSEPNKRLIHSWIAQGARTARPEPEDADAAQFTLEERQHWAFQPVAPVPIPASQPEAQDVLNPIDAFIAKRLGDVGLAFSPPAAPRTLLRRLHFDLTGLPPDTSELQEALHELATHPNATERVIDRLLASPQFGVRWGRHWLDNAGYADTDGGTNTDADPKRPHAWRYRDYVVDAINANKPVDDFLIEQLAGDELLSADPVPGDPLQAERLAATGFMRMAPDPTQSSNSLEDRNNVVSGIVQVVGQTTLGLSVECAQCHDHKYDPIGAKDYYALRAVFDPAFSIDAWRQPNQRLVDFTLPKVQAEADRIEAKAKALEDDLNERRRQRGAEIQELKLAAVPEQDRDATRVAVLTPAKDRSEAQKALLDRYPMVKPVPNIVGLLVEYDGPAYRKFEKEQASIAKLRATKPPGHLVMVALEPNANPLPTSQILFRGNPHDRRETVSPAELGVLGREFTPKPTARSSGRRLAYAQQLTDGTHPLTARVFVNRLWMHHFGRGLVATPSDFGLRGDRPSHPQLLDWLAHQFAGEVAWDRKYLQRLMVSSLTYQQSSRRSAEQDAHDPENRWLGRSHLRRLDAEALRDALWAVANQLDQRLHGPSLPVTENGEGKAVIGVQKMRDGLRVGVDDAAASGANRRSIFVEVQRRLPLNMLSTFDQPVMTPNCDRRRHTTVATQALWFLNDEAIGQRAAALAHSLIAEASDLQGQIGALHRRLFAQAPTGEETRACAVFVSRQLALLQNHDQSDVKASEAHQEALTALCHVMLASNRFLYID